MRISYSQLPSVNPLVVDYFENYEKVAEFYNGDFRDCQVFQLRSEEVEARDIVLKPLVSILKRQNQRFGCSLKTLERIDLLLEKRACAVVTGQQAGLFSGPLLTIYKALTAIKLAAHMNRNCHGCYVPIFWIASDDHDFREVNHINIIDKNNQVTEISYNAHPIDTQIPISKIILTSEILKIVQQLEEATHPTGFKEKILFYI